MMTVTALLSNVLRNNLRSIEESRSVSLSDTSRRTADVADALAPATGTYSMIVYSVFKDQAADFLWLYLNCTCSSCEFLLPRRYSFEVIHDLKICNQGLYQSARPIRLPNQ